MADIRPFRAWRYHPRWAGQMEKLTSPLFDVVSPRQRAALYREPYNSIHLSVPLDDNPAAAMRIRLQSWKDQGVLVQDSLPGFYAYYQHFSLPGSDRTYCRKGFIAHIRVHDWHEGIIRRHENTIPGAVNDRTALLAATQLHSSPTHGLYHDPDFSLEPYLDEAMRAPLYEVEDYQGVRDVLAPIHDQAVLRRIRQRLQAEPIILADGHHRYESSLAYRRQRMAADPNPSPEAPYHFHLMYLTNAASDDLRILPTHRVVAGLPDFDADTLLERLGRDFTVQPLDDPYDVAEVIAGKAYAYGLLLPGQAYKLRLRPEAYAQLDWNFPEVIRQLDLTVLHYFALERALGLAGPQQRRSPHLRYERRLGECLQQVEGGQAQAAFITREVPMADVLRVCESGYTMPQKSTYFYPKVIGGFLFSSIAEDEIGRLPHCHV